MKITALFHLQLNFVCHDRIYKLVQLTQLIWDLMLIILFDRDGNASKTLLVTHCLPTDSSFSPQGWVEPQTQGLHCAILIDWCCLLANSGSPGLSFIQICMLRNKDRKWKTHVWIFTLTAIFFFWLHDANCHENVGWQEMPPPLSWYLMMWHFINPHTEDVIWFHFPHSPRGQSPRSATEQGLDIFMRADACQRCGLDPSHPVEGQSPSVYTNIHCQCSDTNGHCYEHNGNAEHWNCSAWYFIQ